MELLREVAGPLHAWGLPNAQLIPAASSFLGQTVMIQSSNAAFQDGFRMRYIPARAGPDLVLVACSCLWDLDAMAANASGYLI